MVKLQVDPICRAFMRISTRTWKSMEKNFITPIQKREDAFTADNLQDLYLLNSINFKIIDFTPYVESYITGADWEMWFIDNLGNSYGFAVQAKKLQLSKDYDIDYIPKNNYPQIDRLFDYCTNLGNLTPLYCFYNFFDTSVTSSSPCRSYARKTLWGCSIAHGLSIKKLIQLNKNHVNDVLPVSFPWHCLVCCPGSGRNMTRTLTDRVAGFADMLKDLSLRIELNNLDNMNFNNPEILQKIPDRIQALRDLRPDSLTAELIKNYWKDERPKNVIIIEER